MSFKISVLSKSPSPHTIDFWEALNKSKDVKSFLLN